MFFGIMSYAHAEQYTYDNYFPSYIELQQGDSLKLVNLTNQTFSVTERGGLFSSSLSVNGTWVANMPYEHGDYYWDDSRGYTGVIRILENNIEQTPAPTVYIEDNIVFGTGVEGKPVAVTTISPNYESKTVIVKTDDNGSYKTNLNPTENGSYDVYVTQGDSVTSVEYEVTDKDRNLDTRLSILQVLESILRIIYGEM